jgi:predicted NUDIX family NTP pyrophosphohydrolase
LRNIKVTPHVAQNTTNRRSAINGRTTITRATLAVGASASIQEVFGWAKTSGGMPKTHHCGKDRVGWMSFAEGRRLRQRGDKALKKPHPACLRGV